MRGQVHRKGHIYTEEKNHRDCFSRKKRMAVGLPPMSC